MVTLFRLLPQSDQRSVIAHLCKYRVAEILHDRLNSLSISAWILDTPPVSHDRWGQMRSFGIRTVFLAGTGPVGLDSVARHW